MSDGVTPIAGHVRHVTIVHGDVRTPLERAYLDAFVAAVDALVRPAGPAGPFGPAHVRRRRDRVRVAVAGADAGERVGRIAALAAAADPGGWRVLRDRAAPSTGVPAATPGTV
jgi:hypothetical protein